MKREILVGVDGSGTGLRAVDWAAGEAARRGCALRLLTAFALPSGEAAFVWPEDEIRKNSTAVLREAEEHVHEIAPGTEVASTTVISAPAATLVELAETALMVVVGLRGRGGFPGLRIGSVAYQVAAHCSVPVVVVGPEPVVDSEAEVVVGLDGSESSEDVLAEAFEWAALTGTRLRAIRAWTDPMLPAPAMRPMLYDTDRVREAEAAALHHALSPWKSKYPQVEVVAQVMEQQPVHALVDAAEHARLLVVGARGRRGFSRLALGGTAHGLLHHAPCPIMVVHKTP
ncbi:universal stress protein [Nocardiopsis ansamitocini]|nr:universal stress protein [Nocardiopsis ansamitocini]